MRAANAVLRWLVGYDVFISYARADGDRAATAIYERLTAEGLRCRIDRQGTQPTPSVSISLVRAIRRSTVFVLVNTPHAATSTFIRDEIAVFLCTKRPICHIRVGDPPVSDVWGKMVEGLESYGLPASVVQSGDVPDSLTQAVWHKRRFVRQSTKLNVQIGVSSLLIVSAAVLATRFASQTNLAIEREHRASSAAELAEGQADAAEERAEAAEVSAEASAKRARARQQTAEALSLLEQRPTTALQTALEAYRLARAIDEYERHRAAAAVYTSLSRVETGVLPGPSRSSFAANLSPTGQIAAVGGIGSLRLFRESESIELTLPVTEQRSSILGVVVSDQGHAVAVTGDGHLYEGGVDSGESLSVRIRPTLDNQRHAFAVHGPSGRVAIERRTSLEGGPGRVEIWQCSVHSTLIGTIAVGDKVSAIDFGPSGDRIVIAAGNELTLHEILLEGDPVLVDGPRDLTFPAIDRGTERDSRAIRANEVIGLDWVVTTPSLVAAALSRPGEILLWQLSGTAVEPRHLTLPKPAQINGLAITPDGRWMIASTPASMIYLWNLSRDDDRAPVKLPVDAVVTTDVRSDPSGRWVAIAGMNGKVYVLDFADPDSSPRLKVLAGLETRDTQGVESIRFARGPRLIGSGRDGRAKVWHLGAVSRTAAPRIVEPESEGRFHAVTEALGQRLIIADQSEIRIYGPSRSIGFRLPVTPIPADPANRFDLPNRWSDLVVSPDRQWVALTASKSGLTLLHFSDTSTAPDVHVLDDIIGGSSASFSQDSSYLAVGAWRQISAEQTNDEPGNLAYIVRLPPGSGHPSVRPIRDPIESARFVERSRAIATGMSLIAMDEEGAVVLVGGGGMNALELWRSSDDPISVLGELRTGELSGITFHPPSGGWLLNPYYPGHVRWVSFDADSGRSKIKVLDMQGEVGPMHMDGSWIAVGETTNHLGQPRVNVLRYLGTGSEFERLPQIELPEAPHSIVIDESQSEITTCDAAGRIAIWKLDAREDGWIRCVVRASARLPSALSYSSDGRHLIAMDASGRIEIWPRPGEALEQLAAEALSASF